MRNRFAALVLILAFASVAGCGGDDDDSRSAGTISPATVTGAAESPTCTQAFERLADAGTAEEGLDAGGLGLTVRSCESEDEWRAAAEEHPSVLGGFSPDEALAMACALEERKGAAPVCAEAGK